MNIDAYRDEIKLRLTGNILELELDDSTLDRIINSGLRELQRYVCSTALITIPFKKCIDLSNPDDTGGHKIKVNAVVGVYRAEGYIGDSSNDSPTAAVDPLYASQWQLLTGTGNLYNFQDYVYNYSSWNTLLQIRNTTSTDLASRFDKSTNKLYINIASGYPDKVTIEYVPRFDSVDEVVSDYWIDVLVRLCVALTKITVGRIRSKFTQSNALWTLDGQTLLDEGNSELSELRQYLQSNTQLYYPID